MKHTKGPWRLEAGRRFVTSGGAFHIGYGTNPATGARNFTDPEELDANARLIAVAPDMHEALRRLLEEADERALSGRMMSPGEVAGYIRAVLAKAERGAS